MPEEKEKVAGCAAAMFVGVVLLMLGLFMSKCGGSRAPSPVYSERDRTGDTVTINPKYPRICLDSEDGFSQAIMWWERGDREEVARTLAKHGGMILKADAKVKLLELGFLKSLVRDIESGHECYVVRELVTPARLP